MNALLTIRPSATAAFLSVFLLSVAGCGASEESTAGTEAALSVTGDTSGTATPFSYDAYEKFLAEYVDNDGMVDYRALKMNRSALDAFVASMGTLPEAEFQTWPENERMAFWINGYNAITLLRIVDHYPIKKGGLVSGLRFPVNSIRQISGVWDKITTSVLGRDITLEAIEHKILRKKFTEPRIHAAIVCAAMSCPPLRNEAFVADRLDEQLEDQSRKFLGVDRRFRIDRGKNIVSLSPILNWFGQDFVAAYNRDDRIDGHGARTNAVLDFAAKHVSEADAAYILNEKYDVSFLDYDWSLNEQK